MVYNPQPVIEASWQALADSMEYAVVALPASKE